MKAAKLQSRTTRHGLIGISKDRVGVAMVKLIAFIALLFSI